jgi:hypothetical protein
MANEHMAHIHKKLIALLMKAQIIVVVVKTVILHQKLAQEHGMTRIDGCRISELAFLSAQA